MDFGGSHWWLETASLFWAIQILRRCEQGYNKASDEWIVGAWQVQSDTASGRRSRMACGRARTGLVHVDEGATHELRSRRYLPDRRSQQWQQSTECDGEVADRDEHGGR